MFMQIAHVVSRRSTCPRLNVGAVVVVNNRIVSIGYNGSKSGDPHCTDVGCHMDNGACIRTVHAEVNAITHMPELNEPASLYVTNSPCVECAKFIAAHHDILWVYYDHPYRDPEGLEILRTHGIVILRVTPNGYLTDYETGEVTNA